MHILELYEQWKDKQKKIKENSEDVKALERAKQIYDRQRIAIEKIKDTEGFEEIVAYWTRIKDASDVTMTATGISNELRTDAIAHYKIAKDFLMFLKNITTERK